MGGDGGSLPTRGDLVKEKEKEEQRNPHEHTRFRWTTCRMSSKPLGNDVATCKFGALYNRAEVYQYMADVRIGARAPVAVFAHLRVVKDLQPLQPKLIEGAVVDAFPRWMCPITFLEANGQHVFCAIRPCGCVLSARALKEVPSSSCLVCGVKRTGEPIVLLKSEIIEDMPVIAPKGGALIALEGTAKDKTELYQSPLERLREERERQREERERVEAEKNHKEAEEKRLLATRKVGALLPAAPVPPAAAVSVPSLSGKRKEISATLNQHCSTHAGAQPKRAATDRREGHKAGSSLQTSAAKHGHLASLFSASFKPAS